MALRGGGAIYHIEDDRDGGTGEDNIEIRESLFVGNYAYTKGGGAWILVRGNGRIINSTFVRDEASQGGELPTTFVDTTTLRATVSSSDLGAPGEVQVTVSDSTLPPATVQVVQSLERVYLPVVLK